MDKHVAIVGTVGLPAQYGGFETLAENLVENLADSMAITVYCSGKGVTKKLKKYKGAKLVNVPLDANGVQSIPYDIVSMFHAARFANIILVLGVSGCIALPMLKLLFRRTKIIVNIDGLEWKRDKWKGVARWFLRFSEMIAVKFADVVVADNKRIQEHVTNSYRVDSELIAYGADHVRALPLTAELKTKYPVLLEDYAFSVCRIEPENNIHTILDAMSHISDFPLVLIGNWNSSEYGVALREKYGLLDHIHLLDPIYDQEKLDGIRSNCKVYLHGHSAGGTNPSLVEAMYLGLPIAAYDVGYNRETTMGCSMYFSDSDTLLQLLKDVSSGELAHIGEEMFKIAKKCYIWSAIAQQYEELF